jgi:phosphoribosyl 1,2-cyclic phosphate phosphodiesterase
VQVIVLGAGSSAGTPVIGCRCDTCTSDDPRNRRSRCSAAVVLPAGEVLLIDTGPDLRQQALRENLQRVDAVLYTHTHADHLHGIDDLRSFCQLGRRQIPLYGSPEHISTITDRFGYTLRAPGHHWDLPVLGAHAVSEPFELFGVKITPVPARHGRSGVYGYRIGDMAWLTDISEIPPSSLALLQGLEVLFLDCLRLRSHPTHVNLEQSLSYAGQIGAGVTHLIHMTHEFEYGALAAQLPGGVCVGYDGLRVDFSMTAE